MLFTRRTDNSSQGSHHFCRSLIHLKLILPFLGPRSACSSSRSASPGPPRKPEEVGRPRQLRRYRHYPDSHIQPHFIQRLPVEILAHIFVLGSHDSVYFPVVASHVCRAWRKIALHTPALWRRITLSPKERMWKERIKRARACSLDIQLLPTKARTRVEPRQADLDPYSIQWHMHMALPYIAQWRSLEVVFPEVGPYLWKSALSRVCATRGAEAPLMEDLHLSYRANDDPEMFTLFSGNAPKLRSATLNGIRLNWLPSLFANLTYLDYTHHGFTAGYQAVKDVISVLSVSNSLVELKLAFPRKPAVCLPGRKEPVTTRVLLSKLVSLHLRVEGKDIPFELAQVATLLATPALRSLRLVDLGRSYHSFSSLKSFFYAYALPSSIRSLRIEGGWYDPRMITPIVQSHTKVRQIVVKRPHSAEQVLNLRLPATPARTKKAPSATQWAPAQPHHAAMSGMHDPNGHFQIQRIDVQYLKAL